MKKRKFRFLALLLSGAMVLTMNAPAFAEPAGSLSADTVEETGAEISVLDYTEETQAEISANDTEETQAETSGEDEPGIVNLVPAATADDYDTGFVDGTTDAATDKPNNNQEKYKDKHNAYKDTTQNFTLAYKAGYEDGYAGYGHGQYYTALKAGFDRGYALAAAGSKDAVKDEKADDTSIWNSTANGNEYRDNYRAGFTSGETVGKSERYKNAYNEGYDSIAGTLPGQGLLSNHIEIYTDYDAFLKSDDFKVTFVTAAYNNYEEAYLTEWKKGYTDAYKLKAKTEGYEDGRFDGRTDGRLCKPSDSKVNTKAKLDDYLANDPQAAAAAAAGIDYRTHWKKYNKQYTDDKGDYTKDAAKAIAGETVGKTYLENYQKGYDDSYSFATEDAKTTDGKAAFNQGFAAGYAIGQIDGINNNQNLYNKRDTDEDASGYHAYVTNQNNTSEEISQYKAGFDAGYKAASTTQTYDTGYATGFASGKRDAEHDQYSNDFYAGFYEIEKNDPNSAYNVLDKNTQYGAGYRKGYEDGYETGLSNAKYDDAADKAYDYKSAEMDAWRVSTDPANWDKSQMFIVQDRPARVDSDGDGQLDDVNQDLYFNTRDYKAGYTAGAAPVMNFTDHNGNPAVPGTLVATSPFQYYFDLSETDHLIDKRTVSPPNVHVNDWNVYVNGYGINNGSVGQYVYAAYTASMNNAKPKKLPDGTEDTGITYILVRYRLMGSETDENYKVKRYTYTANGKEIAAIENINNYYNGTEPVVGYDSRRINGKKPVKKDYGHPFADNDKASRYIIDAEAVVVSWTEGQPARLLGKLDLDAKAKDNVNATVPHTYLDYQGDTALQAVQKPLQPAAFPRPVAYEIIETDKPVGGKISPAMAGAFFSKYYKVSEENKDLGNSEKGVMGRVAFAAPASAPLLTKEENSYIKKNTPTFILKAKKIDPALKPYAKEIKKALKDASFNFEISRMKIASDYVTDMDTLVNGKWNGNYGYGAYHSTVQEFPIVDNDVFKLLIAKFMPAPKKSEWGSKYSDNVQEYLSKKEVYENYINSEEFKKAARDGFKKAREAYKAQYAALKTTYGSNLDYLTKWIEGDVNGWAAANNAIAGINGGNPVTFPYTVTKDDRTDPATGNVVPPKYVKNGKEMKNEEYRVLIPDDANCDGVITAIEHYEHIELVPSWAKGVDDPRFDGVLQAGDNITGFDDDLANGYIDYDDVDVAVTTDFTKEVQSVDFTYYSFDGSNVRTTKWIHIMPAEDGTYQYFVPGPAGGPAHVIPSFNIYINFLEERNTDIRIVEENDPDPVLWPGAERMTTMNGANDDVVLSFIDPVVKAKKGVQTLNVKPVMNATIFGGLGVDGASPSIESEKKLKTVILKEGATPKPGKADIQIEQKMAESEPFIVATGVNNYEGSIAMRQRHNGEIGYGYFKNDDFYYIFNVDE